VVGARDAYDYDFCYDVLTIPYNTRSGFTSRCSLPLCEFRYDEAPVSAYVASWSGLNHQDTLDYCGSKL
jgi:hypothetical protein